MREELESALQSLEPRDRMLLTLTFLEGYSIAETAAMMDMTPINVRVRVHRSKVDVYKRQLFLYRASFPYSLRPQGGWAERQKRNRP